MTKKARFIKTNPALSPGEKEQILSFFTKHPNYENSIDWNKRALSFAEFKKVFTLAENSAKSQKEKMRSDPKAMMAAHNCPVIGEAKNFIIAVPLDWQAAVFCNSFRCGGQGAKWCIGDSKSSETWEMHSKDKIIYFIYFKKEDLAFGKKLMVTHDRALNDWNVYYQNDRSSNFELLQYELKNNVIAPVKPEGPLNFEPMEHLSLLLGRIEPVKLEALKYKMKGDRLGMDKPKEAIAAYTKAMELDPLCDGAQKSRALLYAKTGQRKKALYELLAVHYPGLKGKPTLKQYLGLIKKCSWAFKLLPAQYKTEGFCYAAVKLNSAVFDYIPKKYKTTELGFEVVKKDVFDCRNIPKKCITAELCLAAVRQDGWVIDYIPKEFITAELCMAAIKRGYDDAIEYVPEAIRTVDLYLESVKDYTTLFNRVPEKLKPDLALALVRKNGLFLDYVPEKFMTAELCLEAVKQTPLALDLVPEQYKMAARAPNILWYIY